MLKEQLQKDLMASLKSGDQVKRLVLGMLMTAVKSRELNKRQQLSKSISDAVELEKQSQLTGEELSEVIAGETKNRKESVEQFRAGGREELAQKEKAEMDILMTYMPEQISEDEIRTEVKKTIAELGASGVKDMGKVIGSVMSKIKGRADGGTVSKITKELLQ